jgi:hypothetical protein
MKSIEPLLIDQGLISPSDTSLYTITSSVSEAVSVITGFYRNYHSIRFVDDELVIRMNRPIPEQAFKAVQEEFAWIAEGGVIRQMQATSQEIQDNDVVSMARIGLRYTPKGFADLRGLIDAINVF